MGSQAIAGQAATGPWGDALIALLEGTVGALRWTSANWWWLLLVAAVLSGAGWWGITVQANRASAQRMAVELRPSRRFDPDHEQIFRYGLQLARASGAGPWNVPRRAKAVRIRLLADGKKPLTYRIEGPASAAELLQTTPYAPAVRCEPARMVKEKPPKSVVRAEFVLRGVPSALLREVPLEPDPLQPLIDAVTDLQADLGDTAEVCVDLQRSPKWRLRLHRWQVLDEARRAERRETQAAYRGVRRSALEVEDSITYQMGQLLSSPGSRRGQVGRSLVMPPAPRRVEREQALGKLTADAHLVRVQLLVRCTSDITGRAQARMRQVEAALDVFDGPARLAMVGWKVGPLRIGPDRRPWRWVFDRRWATGQMRAPRSNWCRVEELAGLLKPPTKHCLLPILPGEIPSFHPDRPDLVLQGWHQTAGGTARLVATREHETLFETAVGKAGWGKTERALCQAIGVAHAGGGLLFIDPHGDSWQRALPYLAHESIRDRVQLFDLTGLHSRSTIGCWNPIGMERGQRAHEVVSACVDGFAAALGWNDVTAPRAMTILVKAVQALVTINAALCAVGTPECQATIFQARSLLTDSAFRDAVVGKLEELDEQQVAWWETTFQALPVDAMPVVLNPLDRLAAHPVARAFLGNPVSSYDLRSAMDGQKVVWVCPAGNGPTDRLLVALLTRDLLRAGLTRRDLPPQKRIPFRAYLDELISLDGAASDSIAEILEQLRKFNVRLHGMTQLLQRLSEPVRASLLQNSSTLTTTAGAMAAIRQITHEWGDQVDPAIVAELDRFHHYATFTVGGRRVGPLVLRGPVLEEVFGNLAQNQRGVVALREVVASNSTSLPLRDRQKKAEAHSEYLLNCLTGRIDKSQSTRQEYA